VAAAPAVATAATATTVNRRIRSSFRDTVSPPLRYGVIRRKRGSPFDVRAGPEP
jgi:hypothetical protein